MLFLNRLQHGAGRWERPIRLLSGFCFLAATLLFVGNGLAQVSQPPSSEPVLRIEAAQHRALIRRIDTDAENRFAVTASEDRTARVWSLPDGKLLRILRPPVFDINDPKVGEAYAVAISPDGTTVAVGGHTAADGPHDIFLYDRASGALKQRLANLLGATRHLAYSSDGRRLAASLAGNNGIRVFDVPTAIANCPATRIMATAAMVRCSIVRAVW